MSNNGTRREEIKTPRLVPMVHAYVLLAFIPHSLCESICRASPRDQGQKNTILYRICHMMCVLERSSLMFACAARCMISIVFRQQQQQRHQSAGLLVFLTPLALSLSFTVHRHISDFVDTNMTLKLIFMCKRYTLHRAREREQRLHHRAEREQMPRLRIICCAMRARTIDESLMLHACMHARVFDSIA